MIRARLDQAQLSYLRGELKILPERMRRRALRPALRAAGAVIRKEARRNAPILAASTKYRLRGTLRKAITVRSSRRDRKKGNEGVFVNVKPLSRSNIKAGKSQGLRIARNDPFYWRFLEFGTKHIPKKGFLKKATSKFAQAQKVFFDRAITEINKLNRKMQGL